MKRVRPPVERYVEANKNFCNFLLALDARVIVEWVKSEKTGRWLGDRPAPLPPTDAEEWEERRRPIQLCLPADTDLALQRWPTGFDCAVLFLLLSEVRRQGRQTIKFRSDGDMLRQLGVKVEIRHRRRLAAALDLWSNLTLYFRRWYSPPQIEDGKLLAKSERRRRTLPPPIDKIAGGRITISEEWRLNDSYFAQVPLPLPIHATTQNLILHVLAWKGEGVKLDAEARTMTHMMPKQKRHFNARSLCNTIGIEGGARNVRLRRALQGARTWFEQQGGLLDWSWPTGTTKLVVGFRRPIIRKSRAQTEVKKSEGAKTAAHIRELDQQQEREQQAAEERRDRYDLDASWKKEARQHAKLRKESLNRGRSKYDIQLD